MDNHESAWDHLLAVTRPALALAAPSFLTDLAAELRAAGIVAAIARREVAPLFDWVMRSVSLQGISDAAAFAFDAAHGGITHHQIAAGLAAPPSCPRLACYWSFADCGYRKGTGACAEPRHRPACPLPRHDLRKGGLNVASYALWLFLRDVCGGDPVGWIDERLTAADLGIGAPHRAARLRAALLAPLSGITGIGPKLWAMLLADLLLASDPARERWVAAGAGMIAVDSLCHNFLHRTGSLRRLGLEHPYGPACHGPDGCLAAIEGLAARFDARTVNPAFPATFPRLVQHALWHFCAGDAGTCNGNRIDDRQPCRLRFCPAGPACDRRPLRA